MPGQRHDALRSHLGEPSDTRRGSSAALDGSAETAAQAQGLQPEAIRVICEALQVEQRDITGVTVLKKGMTNRSFLFSARGKKYIIRIPGEGTERLIDRHREATVYEMLRDRDICDQVIYLNGETGYKITAFLPDSRACDPTDPADLTLCMAALRSFHQQKLRVRHTFDLFAQIEFYEKLRGQTPSAFADYEKTKEHVYALRPYIEAHCGEKVLTHIDAVPDNFLITPDGAVRLIDWEYAGMQDPHVDVAMFCIYSLYERAAVERLIDIYFRGACPRATRLKIYCYIAVCGLLWSNWCEYKRTLGVQFGEYSLRQYRYAREYAQIVLEELDEGEQHA